MSEALVFGVSDFAAVLNQTLEFAYPSVVIEGELANFKVSKGKWVYFDLKDEYASVRFFGSVYNLPGPLEDGMMLQVRGAPRLHPQFGFSVTVQNIQPVGEGSIRKAADLLAAKLQKEGLFDESRKRGLPYAPARIGLIASDESAAYADFNKILNERWSGVEIDLVNVQVQGESSPGQIITALDLLNQQAEVEVIVMTRGGGSPEDLAAFSTEQVVRAVAASRIPTLVAIGHEVDVSLAELAADQRASTPSNAAQMLVPDRREVAAALMHARMQLASALTSPLFELRQDIKSMSTDLAQNLKRIERNALHDLRLKQQLLNAFSPEQILKRGYAIIRQSGKVIRSAQLLDKNGAVDIQFADGIITKD
jgi:exodeoxyribonuclease VII large subunit